MNRSRLSIPLGLGFLVAAGFLTACSSSGGSASGSDSGSDGESFGGSFGGAPVVGPDVPVPAGVKLQPDVVIVHGGASVLKALSSDHGVWTIDKKADGASKLAVGKVLLIAGVDCARVTALKDTGNGTLDVTIAPVSFTDVIQEGSLDWKSTFDPSKGILGQVPYSIVVEGEATDAGSDGGTDEGGVGEGGTEDGGTEDADTEGGTGCDDAGPDGGPCVHAKKAEVPELEYPEGLGAPTNMVSLSIGNWKVMFSGGFSGDQLMLNALAKWGPTTNIGGSGSAFTLGSIGTDVSVKVIVNNVKSSLGSLSISGGTIKSANITSEITGSADLGANMSTLKGSQFPQQALLKLPFSIEYPVFWGPVPLYVSYSIAFLIQPSLATKNSVLGLSTHLDFSGTAGMTFSGVKASPSGVPSLTTPANPLDTATAPPEIGTMAVVFAVQGPRVGFGIGTSAFGVGTKAGVFVDVVNSLGLTIASTLSLVPCQSADWTGVAHAGGEMSIKALGATASITHQISLTNIPEKTWYTPMVSACKP